MPPNKRPWANCHQSIPPIEQSRQQRQGDPRHVVDSTRLDAALDVETQLAPQEKVFRSNRVIRSNREPQPLKQGGYQRSPYLRDSERRGIMPQRPPLSVAAHRSVRTELLRTTEVIGEELTRVRVRFLDQQLCTAMAAFIPLLGDVRGAGRGGWRHRGADGLLGDAPARCPLALPASCGLLLPVRVRCGCFLLLPPYTHPRPAQRDHARHPNPRCALLTSVAVTS